MTFRMEINLRTLEDKVFTESADLEEAKCRLAKETENLYSILEEPQAVRYAKMMGFVNKNILSTYKNDEE